MISGTPIWWNFTAFDSYRDALMRQNTSAATAERYFRSQSQARWVNVATVRQERLSDKQIRWCEDHIPGFVNLLTEKETKFSYDGRDYFKVSDGSG